MSDYEETEKRGYPLPVPTNFVSEDVEKLRIALEMIGVDVDALIMAMSGKAADVHAHTIGDVDGLDSVLDGKADKDHDHSLGGLSNVLAAVDSSATGSVFYKTSAGWTAGNPGVVLGNHQHTIANVEGLQLALDAKLDATSLPAAFATMATESAIADADGFVAADASDSGKVKRFLWSSLKSTLKTYFDAIYTAVDHGHSAATTTVAGFMSSTDKTKLNGIAAGAQVNPNAAAIKTSYESNGNTNAYTDAEKTKLAGLSLDSANRARANHTGTQDISATTTGVLPVSRGGTGQTTEAGMRGVYTGGTRDNLDFPIGTIIAARWGTNVTDAWLPRVSLVNIHFSGNENEYLVLEGPGGLSGTWRSRGQIRQGAAPYTLIAQRTG